MVKKYGKEPANARCDVDYRSGKPKIMFAYPKDGRSVKKQALAQNMFGVHSIIFVIIAAFVFYGGSNFLFEDGGFQGTLPEACIVELDEHYLNLSWYTEANGRNVTINKYDKWIEGANFTCDNGFYKVKFREENSLAMRQGFYNDDDIIDPLLLIGAMFSFLWLCIMIVIVPNYFLTKWLIKQRWYQKWLPKFNADLLKHKNKYKKFKPKDVENNIVDIPNFRNIVLDYKTKGDFSEQLERIKIREHSYHKYKKGKVGKKKVSTSNWSARFYFKNKPKDGWLEVIFR